MTLARELSASRNLRHAEFHAAEKARSLRSCLNSRQPNARARLDATRVPWPELYQTVFRVEIETLRSFLRVLLPGKSVQDLFPGRCLTTEYMDCAVAWPGNLGFPRHTWAAGVKLDRRLYRITSGVLGKANLRPTSSTALIWQVYRPGAKSFNGT